jgi:hypothetical protein
MLRHGFLILFLVLTSLTTAATVHAREFQGSANVECSGYVHSQDDADQTPGDGDKATPHHHSSCHGGPAFIPAKNNALTLLIALTAPFPIPADSMLDRWSSGPDLRPPIA